MTLKYSASFESLHGSDGVVLPTNNCSVYLVTFLMITYHTKSTHSQASPALSMAELSNASLTKIRLWSLLKEKE